MRVYVCVLERKGNRVFASRTLVVVWTAVYLTGYSDWLTGFWEPLLLPYSCHTCLKNAKFSGQLNLDVKLTCGLFWEGELHRKV